MIGNLHTKAKLLQLWLMLLDGLQFARGKIERDGCKQKLRYGITSLERRHHAFKQDALVGRMLINQIQALFALRDDIALRKLSNHTQAGQTARLAWVNRVSQYVISRWFSSIGRRVRVLFTRYLRGWPP